MQSAIGGGMLRKRNVTFLDVNKNIDARYMASQDATVKNNNAKPLFQAPVIWMEDLIQFLKIMGVVQGSNHQMVMKVSIHEWESMEG